VIQFTAADTVSLTSAPKFTTIELGSGGATDTTLARGGAGLLTVEGVSVRMAGKTSIPIPASAMVANTTNGADAGTSETATNDVMYRTFDFDTTTQQAVQFFIPSMPKAWNLGTVTAEMEWTATSGTPGDTVVWDFACLALRNDDALDTAFGTEQTSSDVLLATGDAHLSPETSAVTPGGTPAAGCALVGRVRRVPASDNLPNDAKLIGIKLHITLNAANDA
jgi:hypothetical protein